MADNKVQFGLSNLHVAFLLDEATGLYDVPVAIPGAVKLALAPEGKEAPFYADNSTYFNQISNNGYTGDIEAALIPAAVLAGMLGWDTDVNGMLVELANGIQKSFALLYEVDGDVTGKRYAYYKCTTARPTPEHNTKGDTITPDTAKLSLTVVPIVFDGESVVAGSIERTVEQPIWAAVHDYALNAQVVAVGKIFKATTAGISGAVAPVWPAVGTVTDGTVVWTFVGLSNGAVYDAWYTAVTKPDFAAA